MQWINVFGLLTSHAFTLFNDDKQNAVPHIIIDVVWVIFDLEKKINISKFSIIQFTIFLTQKGKKTLYCQFLFKC